MSELPLSFRAELMEDSLKYADNVNPNLFCCICRMPFIDPYTTTSCHHTFCSLCIREAMATVPQCPICRCPLSAALLSPAPIIVRQLVDELLVVCPHSADGCAATPQRYLKEAHLRDECQYVVQKCSNPDCNARMMRKDMAEHRQSHCTESLLECQACGERIRRGDFDQHCAKRCFSATIPCPGCSTSLSPSSFQSHIALCPSLPVSCPHVTFGCSAIQPRADLSDHLKSCPYEAMKGFLAVFERKMDGVRHENERLRRRLFELETKLGQCNEAQREMELGLGRALGPWFRGNGREVHSMMWDDHDVALPEPPSVYSRSATPAGPYDRLWMEPDTPTSHHSHSPSLHGAQGGFNPGTVPAPYPLHLGSVIYTTPAPIVPPITPSSGGLTSALASLHGGLVRLSSHVEAQSRRNEVRLQTESLTIREEVGEIRSILHGLRLQVHSSLGRSQPAAHPTSRLPRLGSSAAPPVQRPPSANSTESPTRAASPATISHGAVWETSCGEPRDPNDTSSMTIMRPDKPSPSLRTVLSGRGAKGVHMHTRSQSELAARVPQQARTHFFGIPLGMQSMIGAGEASGMDRIDPEKKSIGSGHMTQLSAAFDIPHQATYTTKHASHHGRPMLMPLDAVRAPPSHRSPSSPASTMALVPPVLPHQRSSSVDIHLSRRKPLIALNMSPDPSRPNSARIDLPQIPGDNAINRKKSTKELVAQFEAANTPRTAGPGRPQSTTRITSRTYITPRPGIPPVPLPGAVSRLTPPRNTHRVYGLSPPKSLPVPGRAPPSNEKGKERSPIRDSFKNLFGLFKKGKSPRGKENEPMEGNFRQRPPGIVVTEMGSKPERELPAINEGGSHSSNEPLHSGYLHYLAPSPGPHWVRRHVTLQPPLLHIRGNDISTTVSLEGLTSVHSLPRSSALTLPPIPYGNQEEEVYVFELEFYDGKRKEIFAVESVSTRAGWVSVLWDALVAIQPGPSLPPASERNDDPFLSVDIIGTLGPRQQLRVTNGAVPPSPGSTNALSLMEVGPSGTGGANIRDEYLAERTSTDRHDIPPNVPDEPDDYGEPTPNPRPLPTLPPQATSSEDHGDEDDDEGASIIRFSSNMTRHSTRSTAMPNMMSPDALSRTTTKRTTPPWSPSSTKLDRNKTHQTIRIPGTRSPSPPVSRSSSRAAPSTRTPSMQTLSNLSVVTLRLARLEASPRSPTTERSSRKRSSSTAVLNTPPLTIRKRPITQMLEDLPVPPTMKEGHGQRTSQTSNKLRSPRSPTSKRNTASPEMTTGPARPDDSQRSSSSSSDSYFSLKRASQDDSVVPPIADTDEEDRPGYSDKADAASSVSPRSGSSSSYDSEPAHCPALDLKPILAALEPLSPQYAELSTAVDEVKHGLEGVAGDVHKVLTDIDGLRSEVAVATQRTSGERPADAHDPRAEEERWEEVKRQLSELVLLMTENAHPQAAIPRVTSEAAETRDMEGRAPVDNRNSGPSGGPEPDASDQNHMNAEQPEGSAAATDQRQPGPKLEEIVSVLAPLLEQQKHLQAQQIDTIRYLNELNPWLQKLAASAEKLDGVPQSVEQALEALGVASVHDEGKGASTSQAASLKEILVRLEDTLKELNGTGSQRSSTTDAVLESLALQRQEQEKLLRSVAADLSNDIRGERLRFVDAMKEATTVNVQSHVEEFKKQLNHEVMRMTQEVGRLRDEKMRMEHTIAELFAIKAKHGEQRQQPRRPSQAIPPQMQTQPFVPQHPGPPGMYVQPSRYSQAAPVRLQMPAPLAVPTQPPSPIKPGGASRPLPSVAGPKAPSTGRPTR